jgi:hypothetical protein
MSMLESDPNAWFPHLMQLRSHSSLDDVKREFYPLLLHKMQRITGVDTGDANHLLQLILESITCCHFWIVEVTDVEGYPQGGVSLLLVTWNYSYK